MKKITWIIALITSLQAFGITVGQGNHVFVSKCPTGQMSPDFSHSFQAENWGRKYCPQNFSIECRGSQDACQVMDKNKPTYIKKR